MNQYRLYDDRKTQQREEKVQMNKHYMTSFIYDFNANNFQMHSASASRTKLPEQSVPAEAK